MEQREVCFQRKGFAAPKSKLKNELLQKASTFIFIFS